uniref:Uncharacterized protein n=1 Tax=Vespula pensylvanica TaxID=30213 RepID=A0A834NZA2_VESPE|nr:hypothetical protein H0235_009750 [Vespula pensylvanica]
MSSLVKFPMIDEVSVKNVSIDDQVLLCFIINSYSESTQLGFISNLEGIYVKNKRKMADRRRIGHTIARARESRIRYVRGQGGDLREDSREGWGRGRSGTEIKSEL